ncbi:MAG: single-stranded-DNA-specific exonuclease RecJ [Bacteroidales bacterium]|nr:single-stranded-DNA-specific exonuclease RecJ [Bacteroidales bacterium]
MQKRWVIKEAGDERKVKSLAEALNVDHHIANLLVQKGVSTFEEARVFFRPSLSDLHDPFLMLNMDKAIERIEKAFTNKEKILVYGDYDVDGTTAVALVYSFIRRFYKGFCDYYIPDRYKEGYGISIEGIDYAHKNNFSLVIALDCGIKACEQVKYASSLGIDFIICDHHRPGSEIPEAYAVLDPKQSNCPYPYKELSGCGLGFKLAQAYYTRHNLAIEELDEFLDLVAVSIAADIVPIDGENRTLAYFGLKKLNLRPRHGLESILLYSGITRTNPPEEVTVFNRELTISDLVFLIGPRINAAGRIDNGRNAVKLLISANDEASVRLGEIINNQNLERRQLDADITRQALEMIANSDDHQKAKTTVVFNPSWHKGVIGIVASRLTESYYRPTIVLTESNGLITGSARSVKDFDIYDAIDACSDLLEHFGGHKYAAGLSLKSENLGLFQEKFESIVASTITDQMLVPEIEIDSKIELTDISPKFFRILKQFAPYGPGNMAPVFITGGLVDRGFAKIVGNNHLKMNLTYPGVTNLDFNAIAFQQGEYYEKVLKGEPFYIAYHIEENEWNGNTSLQLNIKDMKFEDF